MPPYGDSFETLSANGDTDISIQDVYDWILFMDDIEITDGGFLLMVALKILFWTLALITLPTQASPVGIQDIQSQQPLFQLISPMFSLLTDPENDEPDNESVDIEADGIMSHEVRVTVRSSEDLPIANAEVRIVNFLNNMTVENCSGSARRYRCARHDHLSPHLATAQ